MSDLFDKAKGALADNKDAVKGGIDKAADMIQDKTPDSVDDKVEMGADKAKDIIDGLK